MLLAGDIGGTKTALAIYAHEGNVMRPVVQGTLPSGKYPSLEALVKEFLAGRDIDVDYACFGVAGPVVNGEARITNLPWVMSERHLAEALGVHSVKLLNDLESIANAVPHLGPDDVVSLNKGHAVQGGPMAVVAPGTGLGEAYLTWDGRRYQAHPSEGGHADFAPTDARQMEMLRYLMARFDHVSYERVCSGLGLPNIYAFVRDSGLSEEPDWLREALAAASDPTPVIVTAALDEQKPCDLCRVTLDMFVSILGAEASNMALKVLATGGVYLGGGIPRRILPALDSGLFMQAFLAKGRFAGLVAQMPVEVIIHPQAALFGAAMVALSEHDLGGHHHIVDPLGV